ncbi:Gcat [Symbiodinium sp. KB8]|nr:Gcat [Symbiodinium sp. KB8]
MDTVVHDELEAIRQAGTYKKERVITSQQAASIHVTGTDQGVLNFCANNYLGLANDPALVQAAKDTLDSHGFGLSSVRFICGTQDIHKDLEKKVAEFHGMEDSILYASCFDANAGLFEALLTSEDAVISDELNHASIIDGIRLCKAERHRYTHMNMEDLEAKLKHCRMRLIATDGVFSMDGDVAPLKDICDLAEKYDARVFIDECHATGFFGPTGRGTDEYFNVRGRVHIINSTLGKALGGATGGYTAGKVGASLKVFDMLNTSTAMVDKVRDLTHRFRKGMTEAGFKLSGAWDHPICPVMLGDARLASEFADEMLRRGIYVIGFSYPVVPKGKARIRVQISAGHTPEQVDKAIAAFTEVGRAKGVIN